MNKWVMGNARVTIPFPYKTGIGDRVRFRDETLRPLDSKHFCRRGPSSSAKPIDRVLESNFS